MRLRSAREAVGILIPRLIDFPVAIFTINMLGAFLLGFLLEALVRRGSDDGTRRVLRLLIGTGFLGGFTTYSALAVDASLLITSGHWVSGLGYALGTVVVGAVLSALGIVIGAARHGQGPRPQGPLAQGPLAQGPRDGDLGGRESPRRSRTDGVAE